MNLSTRIRLGLVWLLLSALGACGGSSGDSGGTDTGTSQAPVAAVVASKMVPPGATVRLDASGSDDPTNKGLSYTWTLAGKPDGSNAVLLNADSPRPSFRADRPGDYVARLQLRSESGLVSMMSVTVSCTTGNIAPAADAGRDAAVLVGGSVTLDGSASADANGDPVSYSWALAGRPAASSAVLASSGSARPVMVADVAGSYTVTLVVGDGRLSSQPDTVTIIASNDNLAPVANLRAPGVARLGSTVTLDGSASYDPNGDPITYDWVVLSAPVPSAVRQSPLRSASPGFVPDVAGAYVFKLVVSDGRLASVPSMAEVFVSAQNLAPVADAGATQAVVAPRPVTLDGSASYDPNGDAITYLWSLSGKPSGSTATLDAASSIRPTFNADLPGSYVASLSVSDGLLSSTSSVVITAGAGNVAPVASAGPSRLVNVPATVTLDGSASRDANGDAISFAWTLVSMPAGSAAVLTGASTMSPTFTADLPGTYVASLTVADASLASAAASVTITGTDGRFALTSETVIARSSGFTATLLGNGKVLVAGGFDASGARLASAELYDPATGSFALTGSMAVARSLHTATLLANGKVLIFRGDLSPAFSPAAAEVYDPATGQFSAGAAPPYSVFGDTATLMPSGLVLTTGGFGLPSSTAGAYLYDPVRNIVAVTGSLRVARQSHTATLLPDGRVLIAGGNNPGGYELPGELYDPAAGQFTQTGSMFRGRSYTSATLLPDGKVLVAGGVGPSGQVGGTAELYDASTGQFAATGALLASRSSHAAVMLPNGRVLVAGGIGGAAALTSAELFDPASRSFSATGSLHLARLYLTATLLPSGKVLVVGSGTDGSGATVSRAELYTP